LKFDSRPSSESTPLPLVTVLAVRASDLDDAVTFTGAIAAREEAALSAEGEGGRVAGMFAEVGDRVRAGALLARIDTSFVAPQVAVLEASLEESRANAAVAEADYRRAQAVAVSGALSVQEIERRGAASVASAAKVKVVGAQLSEARERLRRTEIRAPFDGIILSRSAEVGQLAGPGGAPLFRIGRAGAVEMRGNIAEKDLPDLEQRDIAKTAIRIALGGLDQPGQQRRPHVGKVGGNRVGQPERSLAAAEMRGFVMGDERPGDGFDQPARGQRPLGQPGALLQHGQHRLGHLVDQPRERDGCHAVEPGIPTPPFAKAPSFSSVAATPGMTSMALNVWFSTSHPTMPNLIIPQKQKEELMAYFAALRAASKQAEPDQ
jgi:biotin carboxyl carrier protein